MRSHPGRRIPYGPWQAYAPPAPSGAREKAACSEWLTSTFAANTKPTQLRVPGKINTRITRTKRYCPARDGTLAKIAALAHGQKPSCRSNGLTTSQAPAIPGYDRPSVNRQVIGSSPIAGASPVKWPWPAGSVHTGLSRAHDARLSVARQPRNATAGCPETPEKGGMPSVSRFWESAGVSGARNGN